VGLTATVYTFDEPPRRNVYENLSLRGARHPSETEDFLHALAYCLEYGGSLRAGCRR
jgi:uncharacterized protein YaeQ